MDSSSILVTGASGFIGAAVVEELIRQGQHFTCLGRVQKSHSNILCENFNLEQETEIEELLERITPKLVLHLAWKGIPDLSEEMSRINYNNSLNFIRSALRFGAKRIVIAGSCLEYGEIEGQVSEEDLTVNPTPFGRVKSELFQTALHEAKDKTCQVLSGRIFFAYGLGQRAGALIPSLLRTIESGGVVTLRSPGASQDFVEVSDVASALVLLLLNESAQEGVYNIGSGILTPTDTIAAKMSKILGRNYESSFNGVPKGLFANNNKLRKLGWSSKLSIEAGLERYTLGQ